MSYLRKRYGKRKKRTALGDVTSTIEGLFSGITSGAGTALSVSQDPYLPEVLCHIDQVRAIKSNQKPGACTDTAPGLPGGIGLSSAVVPMRMYVFAQEHPWVYFVAAGAVLGLPWWLGYSMGKGRS